MRCLIVYAHPNPKSFNHAVLERLETALKARSDEVKIRDLYDVGFDPVLKGSDFQAMKQGRTPKDIKAEQGFVKDADMIFFVYPIWWFGMPAILKGYIDRVFSHGFAYKTDETGLIGLLKGKKVGIINTTGGQEDEFTSSGCEIALRTTTEVGTFETCGMEVVFHKYFHGVPYVDDKARKEMLNQVESLI